MAAAERAFGEALRTERERRGVSLESLCVETKVNPRHFAALEDGDYQALPGGVFRRGIVRAYLHALGLAEAEWMSRFQISHANYQERSGERDTADDEAWATFAKNVKKNRTSVRQDNTLRWLGVAAMLVALAAAAWAVWQFLLARRIGL